MFGAGDIDYRMFQTIVFRTDLIVDPEVLGRWTRCWRPMWAGGRR
ncbi:HNH endonuclease domain protein [Mycobacterium intracellulare 1956]|uniref:HNH endonuclease domain protein n=1 Tax=Mycobacterium intracellulare 1956 TaxID=1299331 RepID=X8C9V7_MYCIT|nr:HNH endonuclease domain protein [Mycobacterium intracellulare 1956]